MAIFTDDREENKVHKNVDSHIEKDRRDLNDELSGAETGRIKRFLPESHSIAALQKRKEKQHTDDMTALILRFLNDPAYKVFYDNTMDLLAKAEQAAENALKFYTLRSQTAGIALENARDNATKLYDGRIVLQDAQGRAHLENGTIIDDPALLESIVWKDGAPSYEDYRKYKQEIEQSERGTKAIRRYQTDTLGAAREKMGDEDNPITQEEMEAIRKKINEQAPESIKFKLSDNDEVISFKSETLDNVLQPKV